MGGDGTSNEDDCKALEEVSGGLVICFRCSPSSFEAMVVIHL